MVDPRTSVIKKRMANIGRIIAVTGGKGGVGKSLIASTLALALSTNHSTGLLDLDFTSPSAHVILGAHNAHPKEEKGIIPPTVSGLQFMSIVHFSGDYATPLRGADTSNALIELLATTIWDKLDYLVIDTPPGIADATLDLISLIPRVEFLVVTTPSRLAFETVKKLVTLLIDQEISLIGAIENMKMNHSNTIEKETCKLGLRFLGSIPYDEEIEEAIGKPKQILQTTLGRKVREIASKIDLPTETRKEYSVSSRSNT